MVIFSNKRISLNAIKYNWGNRLKITICLGTKTKCSYSAGTTSASHSTQPCLDNVTLFTLISFSSNCRVKTVCFPLGFGILITSNKYFTSIGIPTMWHAPRFLTFTIRSGCTACYLHKSLILIMQNARGLDEGCWRWALQLTVQLPGLFGLVSF